MFSPWTQSVTSALFAKNKDLIPRGLKNHADSIKIFVSQTPRHAVWFFDPCVTLLIEAYPDCGFEIFIACGSNSWKKEAYQVYQVTPRPTPFGFLMCRELMPVQLTMPLSAQCGPGVSCARSHKHVAYQV